MQACAGLVLLTLFVQSSVAKESKEVARLKRDRLGEFLNTQQQLLNASFIAKWHFSFNSWRIWFFYSGEAIKVFKNISNLLDVSGLGEIFWKRFPVERFPCLSSPQYNSLLTALLSLLLTLTHNKPAPSSYWSCTYSHTVPL